jgi:hypothetical protein
MADGRSNPIDFGRERIDAALIHEASRLLYLADSIGDTLAAYSLPDLILQWETNLPLNSGVHLLPLPDGGVLAMTRANMTAVSADGSELWTELIESQLLDWQLTDEALYLTTDGNNGRLWRVQPDQAETIVDLSGKLARHENGLWLYNREGLYRIDLSSGEPVVSLNYQLPTGTISRGDLLTLPDGGLLLAHADITDRRLLQFDVNGRLIWERSYAGEVMGNVTLHLVNGQPYLAASLGSGNDGQLTLYALDQSQNSLTRQFEGGSRTPIANDMWVTAVADNQLLINVGGGPLALFDPVIGNQ